MALGYEPNKSKLLLSTGADWVCTLDIDGEWPEGTTCWVQVGDLPQWDGAVDATEGIVAFKVEAEVTDPVKNGTPYTIYVRYPTTPETTEYAWFEDIVKRTRR
ncbi:hypothetical protein L5G28_07840 [Gordonia sp. HY285]|uniref:LtfC-like domain-containing protein n=1 Tax=Gordonia liuliyuniae TaxID=2911517 RepID=UPI001F228394|nr:hypothetical protein [Gordonia liuliyuniae]MCF8610073.1 hypothetical protein [Gordonia liuliyuniae]